MKSLILSTKVFLISAGILSLAIAIKLSFPVALNEIPVIWSVLISWLKPPYLYLIINGIIITIAATSRFHHTHSAPVQSEHSIITRPEFSSFSAQQHEVRTIVEESFPVQDLFDDDVVEVKPVLVNGLEVDVMNEEQIIPEIGLNESIKGFETEQTNVPKIEGDYLFDDQEMVSSEICQSESLIPVKEKPLVDSRIRKRKPVGTNPQVPVEKAVRMPRPTNKHDTLENTWKMITEGRLHTSETFEQHVTGPVVDHVPKSESDSIRKESSPGQEELNRRVEEFIKKINEDMRIQRQESLNQYVEMISRGV